MGKAMAHRMEAACDCVIVDCDFEAAKGIYECTGSFNGRKKYYCEKNRSQLKWEMKGGDKKHNWAANHWIKGNGWVICQGVHHRYGFASDEPLPPMNGQLWMHRVEHRHWHTTYAVVYSC